MKNIIYLNLLIVTSLFANTAVAMHAIPSYIQVTFVNKTGHDITVLPSWKDKSKERIPRQITTMIPRYTLSEPQNLNELAGYEINYASGLSSSLTGMTIDANELSQRLAQMNSDTVDITIKPTWGGLGFAKPNYNIPERSGRTSAITSLGASIAVLSPALSQSEENRRLYAELNLLPGAQPFEILGLPNPPPKIKTEEELEKYLRSKEGAAYRQLLEDNKEKRMAELDNGSLYRDLREYNKIPDFTKKVKAIVLDAYYSILHDLRLR